MEVKWPWGMVWLEYVGDIIAQIRDVLPPDHDLQRHKLFPGIKWDKRPIFIVEDDTTGEYLLMDFEKRKRWKKTKYKVPTIKVLASEEEAQRMIHRDHLAECSKYDDHDRPENRL